MDPREVVPPSILVAEEGTAMDQQTELVQGTEKDGADGASKVSRNSTPEGPEALRAELEAARKSLEEQTARAATLERALEESQQVLQETQRKGEVLQAELASTLGRYRDALLAAAPDVPPELVQGETVAALEEGVAQAKALVERVRRQVEAQVSRERVPPGAPTRSRADLSGLSPQEKILLGLRQL
jgi:hypothetical protein